MMKSVVLGAFLAGAVATGVAAQEEVGKQEYMIACAGCHGESAKGDGPLAGLLNVETPDLTTLTAEKGDGAFPFEYAVWMVDGRKIIRAHGDQMPIWGDRYMASVESAEAATELPETRELLVRGRILSLVYYLESIQE